MYFRTHIFFIHYLFFFFKDW
ncbi:hypothetical protein MXB_4780 [Myxobolus squamalis]|nr:hypothetical protein MXB_4780 [Myxobolus squamalis]